MTPEDVLNALVRAGVQAQMAHDARTLLWKTISTDKTTLDAIVEELKLKFDDVASHHPHVRLSIGGIFRETLYYELVS